MKQCRIGLLLLLAVICSLTACGKKEEKQEALKEGEYYLYYTNQTNTRLRTEICSVDDEQDVSILANRLLRNLQEPPKNVELKSVIPDDVKVLRTELGSDGQLFVYFNAAYNGMEPIPEIMCRAAVVKTLTQIDGVEFVGFYANDQPLLDASRNTINMMSASSFVDSTGGNTAELQRVQLTLYYADESGTSLVATEKTVVCSTGISMEQLVVSQLIEGIDSGEAYDTLPRSVSLISVTVKRGVCYVNLDSAFLNNALNVSEYIPIYSIVNSLTELPNINKVSISVDGVNSVKFRDSISLDQLFERKLEYVKNPGEAESIEETTGN